MITVVGDYLDPIEDVFGIIAQAVCIALDVAFLLLETGVLVIFSCLAASLKENN
jgi:predicted lysophospholipase L1 biosynthesis ABC-type transport system permease subunit